MYNTVKQLLMGCCFPLPQEGVCGLYFFFLAAQCRVGTTHLLVVRLVLKDGGGGPPGETHHSNRAIGATRA